MSKITETPLLPRPVEALPDYANAAARKSLADKLADAFGLSRPAAMAVANAVVDPSAVRKGIGEPSDPAVDRIPVPGGFLLGVRTQAWARRAIPDPRNPRILPARKHPFAVEPGSGREDSRFRPIPEPRTPAGVAATTGELAVDVESRHHLSWASREAATFVLATNDWSASIKSQGVMEAVWLVPTTYRHADGSDPVTVLTTAEGSSRLSAVHRLLGVASADVPYDDSDAKFRAYVRRLNEGHASRASGPEEVVALRCERIPALVLVGFVPYQGSSTAFPTALKSLVALRHVDPPTPWGEGPENEALADEVLDELERKGLISATQAAYYAGSCTKTEARAAHLSVDPTIRAAEIVGVFTNPDSRFREAIRMAVTSQSTRKVVNQGLLNALATALVLRAVSDDPGRVDQVRRYLRRSFGKAVHAGGWQPTGRDTAALVDDALAEMTAAIGADRRDDPGPSTLELAVRSAFPLVVDGRLIGDRGTAGNTQPDRRTPGEVLDAMRQSIHGIHQLGRALSDHAAARAIRAVGEDGTVVVDADGTEVIVNDTILRGEFPGAGNSKARRPGDTPGDRYANALAAFAAAMKAASDAFDVLGTVDGDDGRPMVDVKGVDGRDCAVWRETLDRIDEELVVWSRTHRRVIGVDGGRRKPDVVDLPGEKCDEDVDDVAYGDAA